MELDKLAQSLIDKHSRRTEHLSNVLRGTARAHYQAGVSETLRLLQEAAIQDYQRAELGDGAGAAIMAQQAPQLSGPLAVQPTHAAVSGGEE